MGIEFQIKKLCGGLGKDYQMQKEELQAAIEEAESELEQDSASNDANHWKAAHIKFGSS